MKSLKKLGLGQQILIGIIVGLAIGFISPDLADILSPVGTIFLRLLKMLMVPLVFFSITSGVCKMGDVKQLATVGLRFMLYIIITSGVSAAFGVAAGCIVQPGKGSSEFLDSTVSVAGSSYSFVDTIISWVPENVISAMAEATMIQIIVFAIFLGVALLALGSKVSVFVKVIDQGCEAMLKITEYVMAVSPIGIASLMATMVTTKFLNLFGFTLPLGNTCGMNGFSMCVGLLCIFASNLYGFPVSTGTIVQFVFLGIVLSVGAAGVKGAGIIMSTVLLETMGMPLSLVPILAAIWPAIDPALTLMNNTSDLKT